MKMTIGAELPPDYVPAQEDLASAAASLIAHALLPLFAENMPERIARANAQAVTLELSYLLDEGEIRIGGKTYRPRLAFVDDSGAAAAGFARFQNMAEAASAPFDIDPEARVTFETPEFQD
ncbi:hypothetical protein [Jannaschia formosa]|uniref:hypothetical protein n=1 Tax=Jannaschia formosa TaxID=2259592 RepID=UPI000E1BAC99|nr:hypothetical protein [Jannaschia formosa]TFL16789.1 hypothetical protein DR046_18035 [Jannaschia formosa]